MTIGAREPVEQINDRVMARNEENYGHYARHLSQEEREILKKDCTTVGDFKKNTLEKEAKKNWDLFYKRNATHFFKDRHWITREFPELLQEEEERGRRPVVLLEAGCGVGNTMYPLLEENEKLYVYACDFSPRAIEMMKVTKMVFGDSVHVVTKDSSS